MFADTYARNYQAFNKDKPYRKEVEMVYRWAEKPKSILDVGCGTAHYWRYFPEDVHIRGIERSEYMIRQSEHRSKIKCQAVQQKIHHKDFDCVTAIFDVINYIPEHDWWGKLPLKQGGFWIFDLWDKDKIKREGFKETRKYADGMWRVIAPMDQDDTSVNLKITLTNSTTCISEFHKMYLYDKEDILGFCGKEFRIVDVKPTERWQSWYKLVRL